MGLLILYLFKPFTNIFINRCIGHDMCCKQDSFQTGHSIKFKFDGYVRIYFLEDDHIFGKISQCFWHLNQLLPSDCNFAVWDLVMKD